MTGDTTQTQVSAWALLLSSYFRHGRLVGVNLDWEVSVWLTIVPLVKKSGTILLESVPLGVNLEDVKHDLEKVYYQASYYYSFSYY